MVAFGRHLHLTGVECDTSREKPLYVVHVKRLWSDRREDWQVDFMSISWNQGHDVKGTMPRWKLYEVIDR